ncbi:MAG TPA: beta-phosphoglucomutase, partial [Trueperaceae bacterium]|nr:beta-phosphoglucomutase [Trueperaceae bacterium]
DGIVVGHRGEQLALSQGNEADVPTRPRLRGVVLDLDGVLADSAELHYRAWRDLADELGIQFGRADNERLRGIDRMTSLERILAGSGRAYSEAEKHELAAQKNASYQRLIDTVTSADVLPGVERLLDELAVAGLPLALASASRNGPALLNRLGIADRFAVIVDPATLERGKPDPEIFERAAAGLGFATDECVGVEDATAGVEAILGAGMAAVGVGPHETVGAAQVVIDDTSKLTTAVLRKAHAAASGAAGDLARQ